MKTPVRLQQFACFSLISLGALLNWDPANLLASPTEVHSTVTYSASAPTGHIIFNPQATLSTDQIDYAPPTKVILPTEQPKYGTPTVLLDGIYVPEESPDGGYPTHWRDNSPEYSDGWMLQVNDTLHITRWIAPEGS